LVGSSPSGHLTNATYATTTTYSSETHGEYQSPLTVYFDEKENILRGSQKRWRDDLPVLVDYTYDRLDRMTGETQPYVSVG